MPKTVPTHAVKLQKTARIITQGGVVAYPTEAVYGLGCDPLNWEAVSRILEIKKRNASKGLILIAADFQQLLPYVCPLSEKAMRPLFKSWPGPATWLLPAAPNTPHWLTGTHHTLAVRVTAHPLASALCRACHMPLVSTSANLSGQPPARSALEVRWRLGKRVDHILHGAVGDQKKPTPIRDATSGQVLRS